VIAGLLGGKKLLIIRPVRDQASYHPLIDSLQGKGAQVRTLESITDDDLQSAQLLVLGQNNPIIRRLYGNVKIHERGFNLTVKKNPRNRGNLVGLITAASAAETRAAWPKVPHYGRYSAVSFDNGRNVSKTVAASERGMRWVFRGEPVALDLSTPNKLSEMIDKLAAKKIVYVGESHDQAAHHEVQLRVLEGLHRQTPQIALGMEMFQRPFQSVLDDYIVGAIDERTFLRRSEYFKRWNMNYHFYKPLLDYARAQRIPVIALNARRELVDKVARSGLESLSPEEMREVPQEMDFSDNEYRERLREAFRVHRNFRDKNFEFFHQAQLLWDETMAQSIDSFLGKNPDFRILVLAGTGHLEYGSGIPNRVFRRKGFADAILLNDVSVKRDIADVVVFPEPIKGKNAPQLRVLLKEDGGKVEVVGFAQDSSSEKAGLKVGDTLLSLDGYRVESIADVKIAPFYKEAGGSIKVRVARASAPGASEELDYDVKL
jgi:uncharacterized iron-regulated protein